jgi:hypothetical protein
MKLMKLVLIHLKYSQSQICQKDTKDVPKYKQVNESKRNLGVYTTVF